MNAAADLDKLAKVLGLVGSDHDGEALAAARKASEMVRTRFGNWSELLEAARRGRAVEMHKGQFPKSRATAVRPVSPMRQHERQASECLAWPELLTDWERGFLRSVATQSSLSTRQASTLAGIFNRVRDHQARTAA